MIPTRRLLILASTGLLPAIAAAWAPAWFAAALGVFVLCGALFVGQALYGAGPREIVVERTLPNRFSLGEPETVHLEVRNFSGHRVRVEVRDTPPPGWKPEREPDPVELGPHQAASLSYRVRAAARGRHWFGDLHIRVEHAPWLAIRQFRVHARDEARVYPDLQEVRRYELMARRSRLEEFGIHRARLAGRGSEFERLRDYGPDDDYRQIDWKATARRHRPTSRVYEVERSQTVMVVLDASRMMAARAGSMRKLDYAVNAALMLAHVAVRAGDRVGLMVISDTVDSFLPPGKGNPWVQRCVDVLYGVEPRLCHVDYRGAMEQIATRCKRRSLVVFFTDLVDDETSSELVTYMRLLRPVHLPLTVTLQDQAVVEVARSGVDGATRMYERAVALELLQERSRILDRLQRTGSLVIDSPPDELTVRVVNRYLELKARQTL